ncbi:MAG: protein kinase [Planctomycetales bacterium]|nr:protein kinase [Planctomycetales bacterium]
MRIGAYETLAELGRGGFGTVYRARHVETGREVALKVLGSGAGGPGPDDLKRFRREVEAARALDHPGIVKVLDWSGAEGPATSEHLSGAPGASGGRVQWVAMELVEGEPLSALIAREPLPWREAVEIAREVADAVAHAHSRGILHRDLKPGNILLDLTGRPHVVDFGLAKLVATGSKLTRTGEALGTPAYMSPEQARGEVSALTPATDVWSLGCVLYEMLAGRTPFEGDSAGAIVGKVLLAEPPRIRALRGDVAPSVEHVLRVCLAKRPRDRYLDAALARDDLGRVAAGERPRARIPGRVPGVVAAGGATLAIACGAAALLWPREPVAGVLAATVPARSEAESLASRAEGLRASEPARAADLLASALRIEPGRDDWRVERGLLLWATEQSRAAQDEWERVSPSSAHAATARLYSGFEAFARTDYGAAEPGFRMASTDLRHRALAVGARAAIRGAWPTAREWLANEPGWLAAMLRSHIETHAPDGDESAAFRNLDSAIDSGIPIAWIYAVRGTLRHERGDVEGAEADYTAAIGIAPGNPRAYTNRAGVRYSRGDLRGALADSDTALALNPLELYALANRSLIRLKLGDTAGALDDANAGLRLAPDHANCLVNRGEVRFALRQLREANEDAEAALRTDPDHLPAHRLRARVRHLVGHYPEAVESLGRVLLQDPRDPWALSLRGLARVRMGEQDPGIADLDAACRLVPPSAMAWHHRGLARQFLESHREAIADLDRSIEISPGSAEAYVDRALSRSKLDGDRAALEDLEAALRLDPRHWRALANRASVRASLGDGNGALEDCDRLLAAIGDSGERRRDEVVTAHYTRGRVRRRAGDPGSAIHDLTRALALLPNDPWTLLERGLARRDLGDAPGAEDDLRSARDLSPAGSAIREQSESALAALGRAPRRG